MKTILTTITPVWDRWDVFEIWRRNLEASHQPGVRHIVFCPGVNILNRPRFGPNFQFICEGEPGESIGRFHNLGANIAESEWIMKLDLDAMINPRYWNALFKVIASAEPREWFNGGMLYVSQPHSRAYLSDPLTEQGYRYLIDHRRAVAAYGGEPGGSNFICRRQDYLDAGGCLPGFEGWGWEDYQQTYALQSQFLGRPVFGEAPLFESVTRLCRDTITKPKAKELLNRSSVLCLMHRWHPPGDRRNSHANKQLLHEFVTNHEQSNRPTVFSETQTSRLQ